MSLNNKHIVLMVTGGIAAYKTPSLVSGLRKRGAEVTVILTENAQKFVTELTLATMSNNPVLTGAADKRTTDDIGHIRLSREADLLVVAPATADTMASMAHGRAHNLALATILASDKPVLIAPAMNPKMWHHPATKRNLAQLREDGVHVVGPEVGEMAEANEAGEGRMSEPRTIVNAIEQLIS